MSQKDWVEIITTFIQLLFGGWLGYRMGRAEARVDAIWAIMKKALSEKGEE